MSTDPFTACAQQLAREPGLVQRLRVDHSPDEQGRCRGHHGTAPHPCSIRVLADLAADLVRAAVLARRQSA